MSVGMRDEAIAGAPDRDKKARVGGVVFDDFSQPENEIVDRSGGDLRRLFPDIFEKFAARKHASLMLDKVPQ